MYAIKTIPISLLYKEKFPTKYSNEVNSLIKLNEKNSLIQEFICTFHDYDNLYFVSKYYDGFMYNYLNLNFTEIQIQFFSACLIRTFILLRRKKIIHRDVHFENLVLDEKQYINLIDFQIAIDQENKNDPKRNSFGSPCLCAPEMIKRLNYDYNSDYYRLGGMLYFMIFKKYPNYLKLKQNLTNISIKYDKKLNYSLECIDFINKLLLENPKERIGFVNIEELKKHSFFNDFNWNDLFEKKINSPFPKIERNNIFLCNKAKKFQKRISINSNILKHETIMKIVLNYDYTNPLLILKIFKNFMK